MCRNIFMAMYSFVPSFLEAEFYGVQLCVFDKLGCASYEKLLQNSDLQDQSIYERGTTALDYGCYCSYMRTHQNGSTGSNFCLKQEAGH